MTNHPNPAVAPEVVRSVRHQLLDADDAKIGRVMALLDNTGDAAAAEALLAPLRTRLAALKPARPIRFSRLLFHPLDRLIVPPRTWRPGGATVPRTVIGPLSDVVRAGLGDDVAAIEARVAGHKTDACDVIDQAGAALWQRAASVLDGAERPPSWNKTGLEPALYPILAKAVAAVLRRSAKFRLLVRDVDQGAAEIDEPALRPLVDGLERETAEGCAMFTSLVLLELPAAAALVGRMLARLDPAARLRVNKALDQALEHVLSHMEAPSGSIREVGHAELGQAGSDMRRIVTLLETLEENGMVPQHRQRIRAIRGQLGQACQARFADSLQREVMGPVPSALAQDCGGEQRQLEAATRNLRALERAARKLGGARTYDQLLSGAAENLRAMPHAGPLSLARRVRLIEILAGPEAAEAAYLEQAPRP